MALSASMAADFSSFLNACAQAEAKLKPIEEGAAKVSAGLTRMGNSFSGVKIIQDATLMTEAIGRAGGASTLTAKEMASVNTKVSEAVAKFQALGGEAPKAMQDLAAATKPVVSQIDALKSSLNSLSSGLRTVGVGLSAAITAPLTAAGAASLLFSGNFEASMTRLVTIAGVSKDELSGVKQHILDLAPAVGIGPQALADAMTKVSSTVSNTKVALSILDIAAKGSAAGMGAAVDVAGALTAVVNSYGAANITAAKAGDILTQTVKDGGAEAKELAPTLANVVPFAAQLGISFEEVGASIATVTKLGVPAAEAVTQLSSLMSGLVKETNKGTEALNSIGLSYASVRQEVREKGLSATILDLSNKFGGNTTALTELFGRIEAVRNVLSLTGAQSATYVQVLDNMKHSTGALTGAFDAMKGTQVQTWNELTAAVQTLAIKFGDALAPSFKKVLDAAKPVLDWVIKLAEGFAALDESTRTVIIAVGAFAAAVGPVVFVMGTFAGALSNLLPLITALSSGGAAAGMSALVGFLGNPLVLGGALVIGGIALAVYELKKNLDDMSHVSTIGKPLEGLKDATGNLIVTKEAAEKATAAVGALTTGFTLSIPSMKGHVDAAAQVADAHKTLAERLKDVTAAQRDDIASKVALGETTKAIAKETGLAADVVAMLVKSQKDSAKSSDSMAKAWKELNDLSETSADLTGSVSDETRKLITYYKSLGASVDVIVKAHIAEKGVVEAVIRANEANEKSLVASQKALDDTVKAMAEFRSVGVDAAAAVGKGLAGMPGVLRGMAQETGNLELDSKKLNQTLGLLPGTADDLQRSMADALTASARSFLPLTAAQKTAIDEFDKLGLTAEQIAVKVGVPVDQVKARIGGIGSALSDLSNDFVQMAQIAGDSFGGPLRVMGETIKTVETVAKGIDRIGEAMESIKKAGFNAGNLAAVASGWTAVATGLIAYYNAIQGVIEAGKRANELKTLTFIADQLAEKFGKATHFSDELNLSIRQGATIASHLTDIMSELGGVSNFTADQLRAVEGVMGGIIVNSSRTWQEVQQLDQGLVDLGTSAVNNTGFVSQFFLDAAKYAKQYGVELAGVSEFQVTQLGKAASGLNALLGGLQASATASAKAQAQVGIDAIKAQIEGASGATKSALEDQLKAAEAAQAALVGTFSVTAEQGAGLAAAVLGDFASMVDHGSTFKEALDALQPSIASLSAALMASGVDGGAAFGLLSEMSAVANDAITGPLTDALAGADQALKGLHNSGILNQSMFTGLERTAVDAYNKMISGGASAAAANMFIAPTLQDLWALQKDFGYAVDDTTQGLIDQAVADGRVGDKHRPIAEQMLIATEKIAASVGELVKLFGDTLPGNLQTTGSTASTVFDGIKDHIDKLPRDISVNVNGRYNAPDIPGGSAVDGAATGGLVTAHGIQHFERGGTVLSFAPRGTDTVPAMLTPGEMVLTKGQQARLLNGGGSVVDMSQVVAELRQTRAAIERQQRGLPALVALAVDDRLVLNSRRRAS